MQRTMVGLWEHSIGCAIFSSIAVKKRHEEPDEISVNGLLHDIGKVFLVLHFPEEYQKALIDSASGDVTIHRSERDHFNTTHSSVEAGWPASGTSPFPYRCDRIPS